MTQQSDSTKQPSGLAKFLPGQSEVARFLVWTAIAGVLLFLALFASVLLSLALLRTKALAVHEIELVGRIVAGLALFVGGVWAVLTYANNKRLEFQKSFNEQQVNVVIQAANAAGSLIASEEKEWKEARTRFWELYWGRLVLFEDQKVVRAMVELGNKLASTPFDERTKLVNEVYAVSRALRHFLEQKNNDDWKISFGQVTTDKSSETKRIVSDKSSSRS